MIKNLIRFFLNAQGYDIIKIHRPKYFVKKNKTGFNEVFVKHALGNFFLPITHKKDPVVHSLLTGSIFEPEILKIAYEFIKPQTAVLDVGANFGQMSIAFSKMQNDVKVYAFEAQPFVLKYLKQTVASNEVNIETVDCPVWYIENERLEFSYWDENQNPSSSYVQKKQSDHSLITITIDSLQIKEPISFMKFDIQGSDLFGMMGAKETILKNKMPILFEYEEDGQHYFNTSFNDYVEFVKSINYKFCRTVNGINYLIIPK